MSQVSCGNVMYSSMRIVPQCGAMSDCVDLYKGSDAFVQVYSVRQNQPAINCPLDCLIQISTESLILAQNERWRRGLGMQVERESILRGVSRVANW